MPTRFGRTPSPPTPALERAITSLPDVAFSSRQHSGAGHMPQGTLVYLRTSDDNDALAYIGCNGQSITESPIEILAAAQCHPDTPAHASP